MKTVRLLLAGLLLFLFASCGSTPDAPPPLDPPDAPSLALMKETAALLANRIQVKLHPDLYGQVTYSVDKNFHNFEEKRGAHHVFMSLQNTSGLPLRPVKLWVGSVLVAATDRIQVLFHAEHSGIELEALGDAVWTIGDEEIRGERIRIQRGVVSSENR